MHEGLDDDPLKTFTRETDLIFIETVDTNKKIKIFSLTLFWDIFSKNIYLFFGRLIWK